MKGKWSGLALAVTLGAATCWGAGCGSHASSSNFQSPRDGGLDSSVSNAVDSGSMNMLGGDGATGSGLTIQPANATLMATGSSSTLQFNAYLTGEQTPVPATWTVDEMSSIGSIDGNGLFTATGQFSGMVTIEAQSGTLHDSTALTVALSLQDNPGMVAPTVQSSLMMGGTADAAFAWLYPYNLTVFPRGLLAPTLQFAGTAPDAVYLHISFGSFDYQGFYGPSSPGQITLAPALWTTITESATAADLVQVEVTKISGGQVTGPITETWTVAQGNLRGTVYYNSYDSPLANGGAVLSLKLGAAAPTVLMGGASGCVVCHSVSGDGSTIVASHQHAYDQSGDLTNANATLSTIQVTQGNHVLALSAMYPDGSRAVTCDNCVDASWTNGEISPSELVDPKTGTTLQATGLVPYAATPSFSPDGTLFAFNIYEGAGAQVGNSSTVSTPGPTLGLMSFAAATNAFSNMQTISAMPAPYPGWTATPLYPSWPVFTPDNKYAIFMYGTNTYTRANGSLKPTANLAVVHVASGTTAMLDSLNGYSAGASGLTPYLPFGSAEENMDYEPTMLPVAVGGYFWVVFTSRREYGNTINDADPWEGLFEGSVPAKRKKLWVAALDIDDPENPSTSAHDISHPAFYLPGQELAGGNSRGFWVLDPCKPTGNGCNGGDECCTGYCRQTTEDAGAPDAGADAGEAFICVPPQACANEYEKCTMTSDCCQASQGYQCIAGFCAQPAQ